MYKLVRKKRHKSIRRNIFGSGSKPRLVVFKSSQHIYAQIIDDTKGATLASASDNKIKEGTKVDKAHLVGKDLANKALSLKIKKVIFDRGGFKYHGRIAALADGARKGGLEF